MNDDKLEPTLIVDAIVAVRNHGMRTVFREMEKRIILNALLETKWNKKMAGVNLGINRTTLLAKVKKYGIPLKNV